MAMALMLQELNAANFSSGSADSGDVLTADGSVGASWQKTQPVNIGGLIGYADTTLDIEPLFITHFGRPSQEGDICYVYLDGMNAFAVKTSIWLAFLLAQ